MGIIYKPKDTHRCETYFKFQNGQENTEMNVHLFWKIEFIRCQDAVAIKRSNAFNPLNLYLENAL